MSKKDIERLEERIGQEEQQRRDEDSWYFKFSFWSSAAAAFIITITLLCSYNLVNPPIKGTWECVEWGNETYVEYWSWVDCTDWDDMKESERPYLCMSYTIKHDNLYEFEEFVKAKPNFNNDIEVKTRQGDCIKEQLVRSVNQ